MHRYKYVSITLILCIAFILPVKVNAQLGDLINIYNKYKEIKKWIEVVYVLTANDDNLEKYLHDKTVAYFKSNYDVYTSEWLTNIGNQVAEHSNRPNSQLPGPLIYKFYIIDMPGVNAFAVPGGSVFVTRSLYNALEADEMAFVLGHEIAHINEKHGLKAIKRSAAFESLTELARRAISSINSTDEVKIVLQTLVSVTAAAILAGYSRSAEKEADILGTRFSYRSNYNPNSALSVLEFLRNNSGSNTNCLLWCTHPGFNERIQLVSNEIANLR